MSVVSPPSSNGWTIPLSQNIAPRSEFIKNNMSEKYIFGCKSLTMHKKKNPFNPVGLVVHV
jgi:hypothetical protein